MSIHRFFRLLHQKCFNLGYINPTIPKTSKKKRKKNPRIVIVLPYFPFMSGLCDATQKHNWVKWINRLAPTRPDLIFTTAMRAPKKYFFMSLQAPEHLRRQHRRPTTKRVPEEKVYDVFKLHLSPLLNFFPLNIFFYRRSISSSTTFSFCAIWGIIVQFIFHLFLVVA